MNDDEWTRKDLTTAIKEIKNTLSRFNGRIEHIEKTLGIKRNQYGQLDDKNLP